MLWTENLSGSRAQVQGARDLTDADMVANVKVAGATPMLEWAGNDTTVFSY